MYINGILTKSQSFRNIYIYYLLSYLFRKINALGKEQTTPLPNDPKQRIPKYLYYTLDYTLYYTPYYTLYYTLDYTLYYSITPLAGVETTLPLNDAWCLVPKSVPLFE